MRPPDPAFADPRLAALYDDLDDDRGDLDAYVAVAGELRAQSVVDVGCGTGALAVRLASLGLGVVGVDPALASLEIARAKPHAGAVTWVHGDATDLVGRGLEADLVMMTGNVAQVFVTDEDWSGTLDAVHACLRPGGWFVFETRRRDARDWEHWDLGPTHVDVTGGSVIVTRTVTEVAMPLVTFVTTTALTGGEVVPSSSTLRFRDRDELEEDLREHGYEVHDVREAPDRPGREMVFVARRVGR